MFRLIILTIIVTIVYFVLQMFRKALEEVNNTDREEQKRRQTVIDVEYKEKDD